MSVARDSQGEKNRGPLEGGGGRLKVRSTMGYEGREIRWGRPVDGSGQEKS